MINAQTGNTTLKEAKDLAFECTKNLPIKEKKQKVKDLFIYLGVRRI